PLGEGKQVKEKFDAIFASTRYLEADLSEQEGKLAASHESVDRVKNQLAPIEEKMKKIDNQSAEIFNIQNNVTKWTSERKQIEKYAAELQDQIENEFQGSDSELKRVLTEFEDKLEDRQRTLQEYEGRQGELSRKVEKLDREKSAILVELGRLEQEAEDENRRKEREINRKLSAIEASGGRLDQIKRNLRRKENDLETVEGSLNPEDLRQEMATMSDQKAALEGNISKLERAKRESLEERVYNVCGSQNFDEGLSIITEKVDRARDQRGSLLGAEHFFKKYTADLQKESPCCPLCHRGFDSTQEIKENLRKVPGKLEKATQEMEEFQEKYDQINQLKPVKENIEEALDIEAGDVQMAKEAQPDVVMIDRYQGELVDLEKKITIQASKLSSSGSGRTLQMVIDEKEELQIKVDGLLKQIDFKRGKLTDHQDSVQSLRGGITGLREEKLTIERDLQEQHKLEEDKANIALEDGNLQQEIKDSNEKLRPLQVEVVKGHATEVRNINHEIKSRGKKNKLEQSQQQMEEEQRDIAGNIDKLRKDLATQKLREQDLKNNLILRAKQRESREIRVKIAELEEKLGDIDRHTAEGRQTELENQIRASKRELQSDMYRGAVEKYRNKMIDLRTTELANTDLEKYYKALDKAIMNYHNVKMEEINKIIRELWRNTYKGNDIETIEIRSDEDDSTTSIRTRKTYNYRVVLIKPGGVVLASLLIRLALAETFCLNCGILALDEPTTNLDRENIESLAGALVDIIKGRRHQKNFQLVVITHDEDFVELLGRSDYVDYFFKVAKNHGFSQLTKKEKNIIVIHMMMEGYVKKYVYK
ncbi:RAD50-like protein, partial [Mya arenaria]